MGNIRGLFFPASKCQKKIQLFTFTPEYKIKMWRRRLLVLFDISKLFFFSSSLNLLFFFLAESLWMWWNNMNLTTKQGGWICMSVFFHPPPPPIPPTTTLPSLPFNSFWFVHHEIRESGWTTMARIIWVTDACSSWTAALKAHLYKCLFE